MLTIADGGGRGGVGTPVLADVICEQPLIIYVVYQPQPQFNLLVISEMSLCHKRCATEIPKKSLPLKKPK